MYISLRVKGSGGSLSSDPWAGTMRVRYGVSSPFRLSVPTGSSLCLVVEGQQPDCLNSSKSQVAIAQKKRVKNQKFDSEERGYFGVTKKKVPKIYCLNSSDCLNSIV